MPKLVKAPELSTSLQRHPRPDGAQVCSRSNLDFLVISVSFRIISPERVGQGGGGGGGGGVFAALKGIHSVRQVWEKVWSDYERLSYICLEISLVDRHLADFRIKD